jgi:proline dehydrogenase
MEGQSLPLVATHDPVMIEIAQELAAHNNRSLKDFEFQMLYGVRKNEQERLSNLGHVVRVYVPYGTNWYTYFIRRLAERSSNLCFFLHALLGGRC